MKGDWYDKNIKEVYFLVFALVASEACQPAVLFNVRQCVVNAVDGNLLVITTEGFKIIRRRRRRKRLPPL